MHLITFNPGHISKKRNRIGKKKYVTFHLSAIVFENVVAQYAQASFVDP